MHKEDIRNQILDLICENYVCLEIGVWKGRFSSRILKRNPKRLYLIDPWEFMDNYEDRNYGGRVCKGQKDMDDIYELVRNRYIETSNVKILRGYSSEILPTLEVGLDWSYIDGDHSYEFVLSDLELCYEKTKDGGYICGDDYNWSGVKQAVHDFSNKYNTLPKIIGSQFVFRKGQ